MEKLLPAHPCDLDHRSDGEGQRGERTAVTNDLLDRTVNLSDLKMAHNPMVTGIEAFQHLALTKEEAEAAFQEQEALENEREETSAFGDFFDTGDIQIGFEE